MTTEEAVSISYCHQVWYSAIFRIIKAQASENLKHKSSSWSIQQKYADAAQNKDLSSMMIL